MQIFVDADACPVVAIVEKVAKMHAVPVTLLCDTNHVLSSSDVLFLGPFMWLLCVLRLAFLFKWRSINI